MIGSDEDASADPAQTPGEGNEMIADESTSALDVSVQAVADMLADRIMVMRHGVIVEHGDSKQIMERPQNLYLRKLLASLSVPGPYEQRRHRMTLSQLAQQEAAC